MIEKDVGFGKCACGTWAICLLNGMAKCLECLGPGLKSIREVVEGNRSCFLTP